MAVSDGMALITGATGYLGGRLARHCLDTTDVELILPVRGAARRQQLAAELGCRAWLVPGAIGAPSPFAAIDEASVGRITSIVHAAAVTRFNVDRDEAATVNVEGTAQVVALARRCPRLESFALVSTVYATGLRGGPIREEPADDAAGFANAYEWSKWAAEQVVTAADDLPWRILRVATVIADDDDGIVSQYNAFHETLKLCFYGLLPLLPGRLDTPLYLATGRFVVDAVARLLDPALAGGVYHVSPDRAAALTLEQVLDTVFEVFHGDDGFRRKGIMRPPLADRESFELMVAGVSPRAGSLITQALRNVAPFARQLYVNKELDNSRLRAALELPDSEADSGVLADTCRRLVATRWGRSDGNR